MPIYFMDEIKTNLSHHKCQSSQYWHDSVVVEMVDGEEEVIADVDSIVMATGAKPNNQLIEDLKDTNLDIYIAGDVCSPRDVTRAIYEGAKAAVEI